MAEAEKKIVILDTQIELKQGAIGDEERRIQTLRENVKDLKGQVQEKTKELEKLNGDYAKLKTTHDTFQQKLKSNQDLLQTLQTGLADSANTSGGGYLGQLADAKARIVQAETEDEQIRRQAALAEKDLADAQARWKRVEREAADGTKSVEKGKKELERLKAQVASMDWSEEKEAHAMNALRKAREEVRSLREVR